MRGSMLRWLFPEFDEWVGEVALGLTSCRSRLNRLEAEEDGSFDGANTFTYRATIPDGSSDGDDSLVGQIVVVRSRVSGVSIGTLTSLTTSAGGFQVRLVDAVRLWSWKGAFTLSEVAVSGVESARIDHHPDGVLIAESGLEILPVSSDVFAGILEVSEVGSK